MRVPDEKGDVQFVYGVRRDRGVSSYVDESNSTKGWFVISVRRVERAKGVRGVGGGNNHGSMQAVRRFFRVLHCRRLVFHCAGCSKALAYEGQTSKVHRALPPSFETRTRVPSFCTVSLFTFSRHRAFFPGVTDKAIENRPAIRSKHHLAILNGIGRFISVY